ncbi:hypothetical protein RMN57_04330 [Kitasatospora sp. CM 4170]|uniref:Uncharacterized protein n=1 Tax=Kitasatospora aburaviensis TaxID=67265 RepID=A0ABW1EVY2_9ACTN|nr:hypothetical protein [Kitasatospora sp. CM 4170]WNM43987.1 hypothetical protein RMN57_04330 [Kitasatospora sp. CM 4170]
MTVPPPTGRPLGRPLGALLDGALSVAADRAGAPGDLRFTERQLYYELCRVLQPLHAGPRRIPYTLAPPVRYARFAAAVERRRAELPGLLPASAPVVPGSRPAAEGDLYDYGLPRLLVCQSREITGMLIANDLHLEAACPIVPAAELPLDPRLVAALRRAGDAVVHVLHDASPSGLACFEQVRAGYAAAPDGPLRVRSMGLVPRHAATLHLTSGRGPQPYRGPLPAGLRPEEHAWLGSGRTVELAAVAPARLLHSVIRQVRGGGTGGGERRAPLRRQVRSARAAGFLTWPDA